MYTKEMLDNTLAKIIAGGKVSPCKLVKMHFYQKQYAILQHAQYMQLCHYRLFVLVELVLAFERWVIKPASFILDIDTCFVMYVNSACDLGQHHLTHEVLGSNSVMGGARFAFDF